MNSILRTIELTTYMLAPAAAGQFFSFIGYGLSGVVIAGWNVISVIIEYLLLALIYKAYPDLGNKKASQLTASACSAPPGHAPSVADLEALANGHSPDVENLDKEKDKEVGPGKKRGLVGSVKEAYTGWTIYFKHPVMKAGVGLAMLFMTVLGFDNITYGIIIFSFFSPNIF